MYTAHPSVVAAFQRIDPRLTVQYRGGDDPWSRWSVCQPVRRLETAGDGLYHSVLVQYPVLLMPHGHEIDQRAIKALWGSRWERVEDPTVTERRRTDAAMKNMENEVDAWARDVGHWHFKRQFDEYAFSTYGSRDPTREVKEWEDRHGTPWGRFH
ncbi:MAG: hypothetical protein R6U98_06600 [Pirellulaceae bacterium]